ncbi:MAG: hypothetical protein ACRESW_06110, partial [Nevskiales bacterium]
IWPLIGFGLLAHEFATSDIPVPGGTAAKAGAQAVKVTAKICKKTAPTKLYHYTQPENVADILEKGLLPGNRSGKIFTTTTGSYSPIEAQMYLALPPNRGLSSAVLEIDAAALRSLGVAPTAGPMRVLPEANAMGTGTELIFNDPIPSYLLRQVR